ncbi:MAG: hypothetical protein ACTHLN_13055 [Tepidisphaeraceae bacterium]
MRKWLTLMLVVSMAATVWAAGREGVVRTKDGLTYEGPIDENEKGAVVTVRGIDISVPRENIASIAYGDFSERWQADYAKLAKNDAAGRVAAGRKALESRHYYLAEKAVRDAHEIDNNNATAADLLNFTISQRRLERSQTPGQADRGGQTGTAGTTTVKPLGLWTTLTPEQINRVKQLEARDTDTQTRFAFDKGVRKRFYDDNPQLRAQSPTYSDFAHQPPVAQAMQIIKAGTDAAKDVRVTNDPDVMLAFRRDVLPLVLQGCATSACHGGNNAASNKFVLISPATDTAIVYTDFYQLESKTVKRPSAGGNPTIVGGVVMPDVYSMIDRARPEASLLLQYGLPDLQSQTRHPYVRGYNGIFRSRDDARYQTVLNFISSLNPVQPDYGFKFTPQRNVVGEPPSTQPATQPAVNPGS